MDAGKSSEKLMGMTGNRKLYTHKDRKMRIRIEPRFNNFAVNRAVPLGLHAILNTAICRLKVEVATTHQI